MKTSYLFFIVMILSTINNYSQPGWSSQINPLGSQTLGKTQYVSQDEAWISASNGKLLHTLNGGNVWTVNTPELSDTIFALSDPASNISFINQTTGWMIATKGTDINSEWNGAVLYRTTNGGTNWSKLIISGWDFGFSVQFIDENNGWITVFNGSLANISSGILRTTNGGVDWTEVHSIPNIVPFIFFVNPVTGWMIETYFGSLPVIKKTTDGGFSWVTQYGPVSGEIFNRIHFSDLNHGWAVGEEGIILRTTNGGTDWTKITNAGIDAGFINKTVFFLNQNVGWIGTFNPTLINPGVLHTTDGGSSWNIQEVRLFDTPGDNSIYSIHFYDSFNGGLTTVGGKIFRTTSGGVVSVKDDIDQLTVFNLGQNYPNPFNPSTRISWRSPVSGWQTLKLFDVLGNEVATLVDEYKPAGVYEVEFIADKLSSGVYFYNLQAGDFTETKKMLLIR
jgi:photosystem II stability/assembly factor-like uncharacterized protein